MSKTLTIFIFVIALFFVSTSADATIDYSKQTGQECKVCHIDITGGGELTTSGKDYLKSLENVPPIAKAGYLKKSVRFVIGFLHILIGVIWFGTILYVHLILKPAYAAQGLPKGELILGWVSIIIVGITGILLTISKVPDFNYLLSTHFGLILLLKMIVFAIMFLTAALVTFIIGPKLKKKREFLFKNEDCLFTEDDLKNFDGKEGRAAYIAQGIKVYDVSESKLWKDGSHFKKHYAGSNLSDALKMAPHGVEMLERVRYVGSLINGKKEKLLPGS